MSEQTERLSELLQRGQFEDDEEADMLEQALAASRQADALERIAEMMAAFLPLEAEK